jgi:hypothetical protein
VGVQEVRLDKGCTERAEDYQLGTGFFVHKRILSAVRSVEFVGDRMSYIKRSLVQYYCFKRALPM